MKNTLKVIDNWMRIVPRKPQSYEDSYFVDHFEIELANKLIMDLGEKFCSKLANVILAAIGNTVNDYNVIRKKQDSAFFEANKKEFCKKYKNKYIAIRNYKVLGAYNSFDELEEALSPYLVLGEYVVEKCKEKGTF